MIKNVAIVDNNIIIRFNMNKVYSLKYSAKTKGLVAVSEHAKRTSKKGMKKKRYF